MKKTIKTVLLSFFISIFMTLLSQLPSLYSACYSAPKYIKGVLSFVEDCEDDTSPEILEAKITPTSCKIGDTIKISLKVQDSESGVDYVYCYVYSGDGKRYWYGWTQYNAQTGFWEATHKVGEYEGGPWKVQQIYARDKATNYTSIYYGPYSDQKTKDLWTSIWKTSADNYTVEGAMDNVPPEILEAKITPANCKPGDTLKVSFKAQDIGSGIARLYFYVYSDDGKRYWYGWTQYNAQTGFWEASHLVGDQEGGLWKLKQINTHDKVNNYSYIYHYPNCDQKTKDLWTSLWKSSTDSYTVDGTVDNTPPEILEAKISTGTYKIGESIKVSLKVQETGSGVDYVYFYVYSGDDKRYWYGHPQYNVQTGFWETNHIISEQEGGPWKVKYIYARDKSSNYSYYNNYNYNNQQTLWNSLWKGTTDNYTVDCSTRACSDPVRDLSATALSGNKIELSWSLSPTLGTVAYQIYMSTSSLNFSNPVSKISNQTTRWTAENLTSGANYQFAVRAVHSSGCEEQNNNIVSAAAFNLPPCLSAQIKSPQNGKKVSGNRLTIVAETACENFDSVKSIRFEYRPVFPENSEWQLIPAADSNHPNPDNAFPYFTHWDISNLQQGEYQIRSVAIDKADNPDSSPSFITVAIDHAQAESVEQTGANGKVTKREKVENQKSNTVIISDARSDISAQVYIPSGALSDEETLVIVKMNPNSLPKNEKNQKPAGTYVEVTLENGQSILNKDATLVLPYKDKNNDGIVDETNIKEEDLEVCYYNPSRKKWEGANTATTKTTIRNSYAAISQVAQWAASGTEINRTMKTVSAKVGHFSLFGLFARPGSSTEADDTFQLGEVYSFPNPAVSGKSPAIHIECGIADSVEFRVYNMAGEMIHSQQMASNGWQIVDGKYAYEYTWNTSGVASGIYIYVISAKKTGEQTIKVMKKLAVIK